MVSLKYFSGMKVAGSKTRVLVVQIEFILYLLKETRMGGCKPGNLQIP